LLPLPPPQQDQLTAAAAYHRRRRRHRRRRLILACHPCILAYRHARTHGDAGEWSLVLSLLQTLTRDMDMVMVLQRHGDEQKNAKIGQKIKVAILFFYISIETPLQGGMIFKKSLLHLSMIIKSNDTLACILKRYGLRPIHSSTWNWSNFAAAEKINLSFNFFY